MNVGQCGDWGRVGCDKVGRWSFDNLLSAFFIDELLSTFWLHVVQGVASCPSMDQQLGCCIH